MKNCNKIFEHKLIEDQLKYSKSFFFKYRDIWLNIQDSYINFGEVISQRSAPVAETQ